MLSMLGAPARVWVADKWAVPHNADICFCLLNANSMLFAHNKQF